MGFDIAMEEHSWSHIGFIFFSIVSFHISCKKMFFALAKPNKYLKCAA
jgi:solute carrier family 9 (sodium/hydrogen exchanger), member 8